ncbi:putative MIT domain superfamily protein [Helianthus anomalus]
MNSLEYFKTHLKYEKNHKIREAITQKFTKYLRRTEEIRAVLDDGGAGPAANAGDADVVARPKTKPNDGEGGLDDVTSDHWTPSLVHFSFESTPTTVEFEST